MTNPLLRRATAALALTAATAVLGATAASAHHCYKIQWAEAAYAHHAQGGTAWVPLSDLGREFLIPPDLQEKCGHVADEAVAMFMQANNLRQEPLIHSRATTGSGAAYQGKTVKPFSYLTEDQFGMLTEDLMGLLETCAAGGS